ncbi:MAG: peptidylprolyl isomerase [Marinifilaceae bacterium]
MQKYIVILLTLLSSSVLAQEKEIRAVIETNLGNMTVKLYNDTPLHRDNFVKLAKSGHYDGTLFYRCIKNFVIQAGSSDSKNAIKGQNIGFGKGVTIDAEMKDHHYHKKGALAAPRQPDRENFFKESDIAQFYLVHGRVYPMQEMEYIEKKVNVPIKNAITKKYYTPEKKALLDSLKRTKQYDEFKRVAAKIKQDIAFEWNGNREKLYMTDEKKADYTTLGGVHHLDREYTVFGEIIEGLEIIDKIAALKTDENDRPLQDIKIKVKILN